MTPDDQPGSPDLGTRLDAAIGAPPPLPSPAERVRHGRRALLRRRVAQGVAGVAAVAVIGSGTVWAVGGATEDQRGTDLAGQDVAVDLCPALPSMTAADAAALPDDEPTAKMRPYGADDPAAYDDVDDTFSYKSGIRGLQHLRGIQTREGANDTRWDAVELEGSDGRWYGVMTFTPSADGNGGGGETGYRRVEPGGVPFDLWVTLQLEVRSDGPQDVLGLGEDGEIVAADGVEILGQQEAVRTPGYDDIGRVAEIRHGAETCYAYVQEGSTYLVPPAYVDGESLEDFATTVSRVRGMGMGS